MSKGQLCRVPWPGNSWVLFTFQPALRASAAPQTKGFLQSTAQPHQSTKMELETATSHTSKWHTLSVYSGCCHGKI